MSKTESLTERWTKARRKPASRRTAAKRNRQSRAAQLKSQLRLL